MTEKTVLDLCKEGINAWQKAFNNQDAAGCGALYSEHCVMEAKPLGIFTGRQEILGCWKNIIGQGFSDVAYANVTWKPSPNGGYILTSSWVMNKAFGVVHCEHWKVEHDGKARLQSDSFEIQGER